MAEGRIDELRRRIERDPGSRLFAQLAEELRKGGDVEAAIQVARAGLEEHPSYPSARLTLGRALLDSGDPAAAREELEAAVRGAPDNILASRLLGEALETLGDLGSALQQYRATLELAPTDGHAEARMRAIEARLSGGGASADQGKPPEITRPMPSLGSRGGTGLGEAPPPPTLRMRMPGGASVGPRAPQPPAVPPTAPNGAQPLASVATEETTLPAGSREAVGRAPTRLAEAAAAGPLVPAGPPATGVGKGVAPRGPRGDAEEHVEARTAGGEERAPDAEVAPTLPRSRAAEFAALDAPLPPTVPLGVVSPVERPESRAAGGGDAEGTVDGGGSEVAEPADAAQAPLTRHEEAVGTPQAPLSSATLGELYFQQGLLERALEVYGQVIEEDPGNEGVRARLTEIRELVAAAELPLPPLDEGDEKAGRRLALERTIERLEALLSVVRRRQR